LSPTTGPRSLSKAPTPSASTRSAQNRRELRSTTTYRIYDYLPGGKDNNAADRAAVEAWLDIDPELTFNARANRALLGRAVRRLAAEAHEPAAVRIPEPRAGGAVHPALAAISPSSTLSFRTPAAATAAAS
jgi:hypothetical protein